MDPKKMRLRFIVIARHGDYSWGKPKNLTPFGAGKMRKLSKKIKTLVGNLKIRVIASTAPRGEQSGKEMADELGVPLETDEVLWSQPAEDGGRERSVNLAGALRLIKPEEDEVDIMVTHLEYSMFLPDFLIKNLLKLRDKEWHGGETEKGAAWLIDCLTGEVTLVSWDDE